ncbi:unnamed protein product [Phytophthora lilii]|uniref:Unnamed protein product n=1 Tax=Phytophthora lilii TaxID=2077276 RepID=A0A9W6TC38_9STRA|nr:unnamed protein product [Phytophthora lilii]
MCFHSSQQLRSQLRDVLAHDVASNAGRGVEVIVRTWEQYVNCFGAIQVEVKGLQKSSGGASIARTKTSFRNSQHTIRSVFPHLCKDQNGSTECGRSSLANRLLGQQIVMHGKTRFEWDVGYGHVTGIMAHSDMMTPMLSILKSLEDVSRVFDGALISPDFQWKRAFNLSPGIVDGATKLQPAGYLAINLHESCQLRNTSHLLVGLVHGMTCCDAELGSSPREQQFVHCPIPPQPIKSSGMDVIPMNHEDFHASISNQMAATSTMVGPLFQRASRRSTRTDEAVAVHNDAAYTPFDSTLVGIPRRYQPEKSTPVASCADQPMVISPFLAEGLQTALRYCNGDVGSGAAFTEPFTATTSGKFSSGNLAVGHASRLKTTRRREQCRVNQARYRLKQDRKEQLLNETVLKLRDEVPLLKMQRDRVLFGAKQSVFNVVVEYFHLFRHGIRSLRPSKVGSKMPALDPEARQQLVFLRYSMAPNVDLGERRGVDALVEQWRRYSSYFDDLHFQLEHMEEKMKNFVVVAASLSVTVTKSTLDHVFPHLLHTDLGKTLLERRLLLPCSLTIEWDGLTSHVERLETSVDFLTPINRVLGSLQDAAFVLSQALITFDGSVGKFDT